MGAHVHTRTYREPPLFFPEFLKYSKVNDDLYFSSVMGTSPFIQRLLKWRFLIFMQIEGSIPRTPPLLCRGTIIPICPSLILISPCSPNRIHVGSKHVHIQSYPDWLAYESCSNIVVLSSIANNLAACWAQWLRLWGSFKWFLPLYGKIPRPPGLQTLVL